MLCAKINPLERTREKDNVMIEERCKTSQDLESLKDEISLLNFQNQALLNELKLANEKN